MEAGKELSFKSQMNMRASLPLATCTHNGKRDVQNLSEPHFSTCAKWGLGNIAVVPASMGFCEE